MKTIKIILISTFISLGLSGISQDSGEIKGTVIDKETGETIIGATARVNYVGNLIGDASNIDGRFNIKPLRPGTYTMTISYVGKANQNVVVKVKSNQIAFRDTVFLVDSTMKTFTILAYKLIDPEETNKPTLTEEELKGMASLRNTAQLAQIVGNGTITFNEGTGEMFFRGSRSNGIITYLDGMKITGTVPSYPAGAIKTYSVYTGGLPAKFGDTSGGVIEINTKSYFDFYNQKMAQLRAQKRK